MSESDPKTPQRLRSEIWFNDRAEPGETAIYLERYSTYGLGRKELQSGRPVIGIAQTGGDLTPCNRIHVTLAARVKDGIRDAGGIPFEFPIHPLQESCRRPTAALDRNLAYLGLVEILCGYPFDGVVLMTGCDKTTPACLMAAGQITADELTDRTCASTLSAGHCNTMGTALSMNSLAEALGMSLPSSAAIPGPYRERGQMAYATGARIVEMVHENLRPS